MKIAVYGNSLISSNWVDNSSRFSKINMFGGVAQVVRAYGSYP